MKDIILILSEANDISTSKVLSFIKSLSTEKVKICFRNESIHQLTLNLSLGNINIYSNLFDSVKTSAIWYRRGNWVINTTIKQTSDEIRDYLGKEWQVIKNILYNLGENKICLGSLKKEFEKNLIQDLINANTAGLDIPELLVTTDKKDLYEFFKKHKKIISKPLDGYPALNSNNLILSSTGAFIVQEQHFLRLNNNFFPTLFQEYILKSYEIRIFFMKKKIYSMAIFSQLDEKTKIDYRNYNPKKPNRNVPYKLPLEIEEKIIQFMHISGLDTGSIDMIKSTDGRYVFLEVNPCGQFDWLSTNCNYYLEKKIAHYLAYGNTEFD
jgi:ATP-GRASP peptide maturase of grasp-with-spasm system